MTTTTTSTTMSSSGLMTAAPPSMIVTPPPTHLSSPNNNQSSSQVNLKHDIKQEFPLVDIDSPTRTQQNCSRSSSVGAASYLQEPLSPYDELKSLSQTMLSSTSPLGYDRQGGGLISGSASSSGGGGGYGVSSSMGASGCGGFSPSSSQVMSPPQYSRHRAVTGDEVQCNVCGRTLCNKYVLKVHVRDMHTPRQNHQCPVCRRCYSSLNSLRVHMSTSHKHAAQPPP